MTLEFRASVRSDYSDVLTPDAVRALEALAPLDAARKRLMAERIQRRGRRFAARERIAFLDPDATIGGTALTVRGASPAARFQRTSGGNGFKARARPRGRVPQWPPGCATSPMRS
jgi:hypothetical protein